MFKLMGHTVQEDGKIWLLSSAAEVGFRVTGATKLRLKLEADDTVQDPATEPLRPRFEVRLDGRKVLDIRMMSGETTVTVFEGEEKRDAEIRLIKLSECTQSLLALQDIETDGEPPGHPGNPDGRKDHTAGGKGNPDRIHRGFHHLRVRRGREKRG